MEDRNWKKRSIVKISCPIALFIDIIIPYNPNGCQIRFCRTGPLPVQFRADRPEREKVREQRSIPENDKHVHPK